MSLLSERVLSHLIEIEESVPEGECMTGYFSEMVVPFIDGSEASSIVYHYWNGSSWIRRYTRYDEAFETGHYRSAAHKMELKRKAKQFSERRQSHFLK